MDAVLALIDNSEEGTATGQYKLLPGELISRGSARL